jgi:very-short-patch-repair endonuclease
MNKGTHHTEEAKEKNRIAHIGRKPWNFGLPMSPKQKELLRKANVGKHLSEKHREKIRLFHTGKKWMLGKHLSDEWKLHLSLANKGKKLRLGTKLSEEAKKKISMGGKGRIVSQETRQKRSISLKANPRMSEPRKPRSEITKQKLREKNKAFWINMTEQQQKNYVKNLLSSTTRISKPQKELFYFLKQIFPDAQLEFLVRTKKTYRFADIGIPSLKLDFEYDGERWHDINRIEKDEQRDKELAEIGWATFRINKSSLKILARQPIFIFRRYNK